MADQIITLLIDGIAVKATQFEFGSVYVDTVDQAKLIRKVLKREFPAYKFRVTIDRYAGGSSVDIQWQDGPTCSMIDHICDRYAGASFNGMDDSTRKIHFESDDCVDFMFSGNFVQSQRETTQDVIDWAKQYVAQHHPDLSAWDADSAVYRVAHATYTAPDGSRYVVKRKGVSEII